MTSEQQFAYAGRTDRGRARDHNEDAFGTPRTMRVAPGLTAALGTLLVVADGMGGRAAGEKASALAVRTIFKRYYADRQPDRRAALAQALAEANRTVHAEGEKDLRQAGMATTVVALVLHNGQAFTAHAGDSRAYYWRAGKLTQLTADHTWVGENVAAGVLTPAEAANHPYRHAITRALGLEETVEPDVSDWLTFAQGDRFLLCSDGLTNEVPDRKLAVWVGQGSPSRVVKRLVNEANRAGGQDNITAVVAAVGPEGDVPAAPAGSRGEPARVMLLLSGLVAIAMVVAGASLVWPASKTRQSQLVVTTTMPTFTATATPTNTLTPTATYTPTPTDIATPMSIIGPMSIPTSTWQLFDGHVSTTH